MTHSNENINIAIKWLFILLHSYYFGQTIQGHSQLRAKITHYPISYINTKATCLIFYISHDENIPLQSYIDIQTYIHKERLKILEDIVIKKKQLMLNKVCFSIEKHILKCV